TYVPIQEDYKLFKKEDKKIGFKTIVFTITDENPRALTFLNSVIKDKEWKIVFLDQFTIILIKTDAQKHLGLPTINLTKLSVTNYHYSSVVAYTNLSTFLFNMHYLNQAKQFDQKALELNPDNPAANKAMAYIYYFQNHRNAQMVDYYNK